MKVRSSNEVGDYCFKNGYICDNNMIDSPLKVNRCFGYCKPCESGSSWEWYDRDTKRLHRTAEDLPHLSIAYKI